MERSGYDHEILTAGIDVLCHNVNEYLRSLKCFKETSSETKRCQSTIATNLRELEDGGRRQQMSTYQYETAKCQLKVQLMECDIGVWKNKCSDSVAGLKNEFECNVLPSSCKNNRNLQNSLQQTCAIQKFARQLRSGSSKRFSLTSVMMTILSASIVLLVL
ncbi:uncharacterized protein LOC132728200 [Ruditapes philippinarum]|uniref:uncharacterized protein LOC132728200 n=1 Tax=Ruditapes philippinarum TaxID=129788 RepID=UPI00295AF164|nr:uncharacterized protein LOC132728200 [Ruditapes philippinarum]